MEVVAVTGGTGFIGRRLVGLLTGQDYAQVRVLTRKHASADRCHENLLSVPGDVTDHSCLQSLLSAASVLVNLVHLESKSPSENIAFAKSLVDACAAAGVRHVVHCSTATVVGRAPSEVVNEDTTCMPGNEYEATKLAVERVFLEQSPKDLGVSILRPTAVFGPGGKNLIKLADDLHRRSRILNYAKSSLQGSRRMNLVHVDNVATALAFLANTQGAGGQIYIVSDDEWPSNNYQDVEKYLMGSFGIPDYPMPPLPLPKSALALTLRLAGRTNANLNRVFDSTKLLNAGHRKPISLETGLAEFAKWYSAQLQASSR